MKPQQQLSLPFHQLTLSPRQLTLLQRYLTLQWRQLKNQVVGIQVYIYVDLYNVSERYTESSLSCMRKRARTLYINKVPLWNVFGTAFIDAAMQFSFSKIFTDTPVLPL